MDEENVEAEKRRNGEREGNVYQTKQVALLLNGRSWRV